MKLIHLSDLHIGKRLNEFSLLEDQEYIFKVILGIINNEKPDGVIIAGDVYDKAVPSAEAVQLFDDFLFQLVKQKVHIFIISGNHDSPERIAFGSRIMDASGVHLSPVYNGKIEPIVLNDEYGEFNIFLLPFIKPAHVRRYSEDEISSYTEAMRWVISEMNIDKNKRNLLITHQFVTGAKRSESEEISVGGSDNIDVSVFDPFDYVALGHLHSPQNCDRDTVRYCGSPLKYSFSEAKDNKSVTVIELKDKNDISCRIIPLIPKHEMVELKGKYNELSSRSFYQDTTWQTDYVHITLTDEEDVLDAIGKLRTIYHGLMKLDYDNKRTQRNAAINGDEKADEKSPIELFSDLYKLQNNQEMDENQTVYMNDLINQIWSGKR